MQTTLTFVAILTMAMLLLCGTQPAFTLLAVLVAVSAVCCIVVSYILRKRTDEKNAKDAALQKKIANWRKARRRQLRSNADSDDMFDACGVTQDLRLSLEEDEQFCEKKHEIEELETQISLWNRIGDAFKHLLNSCAILVCLLALSSFTVFALRLNVNHNKNRNRIVCAGDCDYTPYLKNYGMYFSPTAKVRMDMSYLKTDEYVLRKTICEELAKYKFGTQ